MTAAPYLLSPFSLRDAINSSSVSVLDATWFLPNSPRKPLLEFKSKHIPGAHFLDLNKVASPNKFGLSHAMPSARTFAVACESFGIQPDSHVVIYDTHGVFSSPRALFMFRAFGHQKSSILDGGLPRWEALGFETASNPPTGEKKSTYPTPVYDETAVRSYEQVVANSLLDLASNPAAELVVDARSRSRFRGTDPAGGHIPRSFSLPYGEFLKTHKVPDSPVVYATFLSAPDLRQALENAIGDEQVQLVLTGKRPITTTCGSGITAAILWLGLKLLGAPNVALYDEAWAGYTRRPNSRIEKSK